MAAVVKEGRLRTCWWFDDDIAVRQLVSEYLAQNDFRVSEAASGAELMGAFRAQVVDLVLLDLRLHGEDGMQLLRQLRAESQLPVIILTGRAEEADRVMGLDWAPTLPHQPSVRASCWLGSARSAAYARRPGDPRRPGVPRLPPPRLGAEPAHAQAERGVTARSRAHVTANSNCSAPLLATANRVVTRDQLIEMSRATTTRSTTAPSTCRS